MNWLSWCQCVILQCHIGLTWLTCKSNSWLSFWFANILANTYLTLLTLPVKKETSLALWYFQIFGHKFWWLRDFRCKDGATGFEVYIMDVGDKGSKKRGNFSAQIWIHRIFWISCQNTHSIYFSPFLQLLRNMGSFLLFPSWGLFRQGSGAESNLQLKICSSELEAQVKSWISSLKIEDKIGTSWSYR